MWLPANWALTSEWNHILCQASRKSGPAMLIPLDRQMMSVSTQTQMLPQRCKVARGNNNGRTNPQTCMCFHICCYFTVLLYNHPLTHPYRHTYTHTVHAQKDISFTHTLSGSSFLVPPRIQGPCLSTLVIMVNSWACYLIAAYGRLVALLGYIKTWLHVETRSDDLCGVTRSFDSGPRPVYWVKSHRAEMLSSSSATPSE